jgi:8-oxo-dGTP diphosphatase
MSRRYPARPLLGVGALIFDDRQRVLLVERGRAPLAGEWSLPGGLVETGERLEDAVVRETWEETGLNVEAASIATVFERIMLDEAEGCEYHYVLIDFYCTVAGGDLRPGDDSRRVAWFEMDSLGDLRMTDGTLDVIETCRANPITHPYIARPGLNR